MNTLDLLNELKKRGITLSQQDGNLHYKAPAGSLDEALKAEIKKHKPVLLRLLKNSASKSSPEEIPIVSRDQRIPLSFAQRRLWLLDQIDEGSNAVFNLPHIYKLKGRLNSTALKQSIEAIIARHEVLRTSIQEDGGQPYQRIEPPMDIELPLVDLTSREQADALREIQNMVKDWAEKPFDFSISPVIRIKLVRTSATEHWLVFVIHHIAFDGWSRALFNKELFEFYSAYSRKAEPSLQKLKIQYSDFAAWQNSIRFDSQLEFWRKELQDTVFSMEFPFAKAEEPEPSYVGSSVEFEVSGETGRNLRKLGQETGSTLFMILLATYELLLYRYTNQSDFIIGVPVANRTRSEIEPLIGFFLNTLMLKGRITGDETFRELLQRVQKTTISAFDNQDIPIESVLWDLQTSRDSKSAPLLQVTFQLQNVPRHTVDLPDLDLTVVPVDYKQTQVALNLVMTENPGRDSIHASLLYQTKLFEDSTMKRMAVRFQTLLKAIVDKPDSPVASISYMPEEELKLNRLAADCVAGLARPNCVIERFAYQAKRVPESIAVETDNRQLSYRELNNRANQLAHWLITNGVSANSIVGLCLEKSPEMLVGVMGILKAGGAYLPLDPANPTERLNDTLADSSACVLLTQLGLQERFAGFAGTVLSLDVESPEVMRQSTADPESTPSDDDLAYVIYTSGSTGKPKGVMIQHGALRNFTSVMTDYYKISETDRVLQFASLSFDASCEEIFPALNTGATLILRTEEMLASSKAFWNQCAAKRLTIIDLPTAFWHQLTSDLESGPESWPDTLRLVIIGGEGARPDAVNKWLDYAPAAIRLVNGYGPTEATVVATVYDINRKITGDSVPIGRPLGGLRTYILDPHQQLVPEGIPGELYIAGAGLAKGYLNRDALTSELFFEIEMRDESGELTRERVYRTGDRVRHNEDGEIEYLGRLDNQIKIRGYRVELGEIETLIRTHPGVGDCAVVAVADSADSLILVGYIVPKADSGSGAPSASVLKEQLRKQLPDYMVPSGFVEIPSIPITVNGKVDTKALPVPERLGETDEDRDLPQGPTEVLVAEVWAEAFGLEQVGRNDDFFDLGGHSILAMRIINLAGERLGRQLRMADLFNHPVLHEFAEVIEQTG